MPDCISLQHGRLPGDELFMEWSKHARDDFIGGLVSAAVAIPLAMGYGMFAFASFGENYFADGTSAAQWLLPY